MRIGLLILTLIFGSCAGGCGVVLGSLHMNLPNEFLNASAPLPHFVPKYAGGVSLRYAMVHDVIHERYPVRGPAYYTERDRRARERLRALPPDSQEAFDLADDLGVGLDKLGRPAEGVPLLRDKLVRQQKAGRTGRDLYTTYANLGTLLLHAHMKPAMTGNAAAKERVKEGLAFLRKSIEVNPQAHFGREQWQVVIGEFLLATADDPALLTKFDPVGNRFDEADGGYAHSAVEKHYPWQRDPLLKQMAADGSLKDPADREPIRALIRKIGPDDHRKEAWPPAVSLQEPVPFDEPTLGIVGMWRQGSGANPYFAVTLGEITLRVGQRYVAWTAFERASRLADKYGWKPAHADFLRKHCVRRQDEITRNLPADEVAKLRPRFDAELAYGQKFQREYQQYEAERVATAADLEDEHFFDDFYKGREPIATPVGEGEWFARSDPAVVGPLRLRAQLSVGLLCGGIGAFLTAALGRIIGWRSRRFTRTELTLREIPPGERGA